MQHSPCSVRPEVQAFAPYEAGLSIESVKEKYGLDKVIKLASNENPLGTSPRVLKLIGEKASLAFRYPASGNPRLVKALADFYQVSPKNVFVANGSDEVIDLLFRVRLSPGVHNAVAFCPCFSIYETQARLCGVELRRASLNPDFSFNFSKLLELVDENTRLVFVTSPDNPSGYAVSAKELLALAAQLPPHCLLVVDEAYAEFSEIPSLLANWQKAGGLPNVALVRTFSKLYALAGLRIGYALLPEVLCDYLWRVRLPFSLNILAEEAAIVALGDDAFHQHSLKLNQTGRKDLTKGLEALGCKVYPSQANFLMFQLPPNAKINSAEFHQKLLEKGLIIRKLGAYNLPNYLRISVGIPEENTLFLLLAKNILTAQP